MNTTENDILFDDATILGNLSNGTETRTGRLSGPDFDCSNYTSDGEDEEFDTAKIA
ncbi:MAG: hypothetical protein ABIN91_01540 [Mucilaginibacter sp.]|uniref:hypothetical protein n=1 Tax=Mucilaginibacter sp. TaxID=1882438 RepID=UPI0032651C94